MAANLQLLPEEIKLIGDAGWILTKNSVIGKIVGMMAGLSETYRGLWSGGIADGMGDVGAAGVTSGLSGGVGTEGETGEGAAGIGGAGLSRGVSGGVGAAGGIEPGNAKISRGENYRGLPWVILDYPRIFGREDVLAIRTMFWWGHPFSVTLHLKGRYQALYVPVIERRSARLAEAGFQAGIGADEWRHEHAPDNYAPLAEVGHGGMDRPFVKLSAAVGLDRWAEAPELLTALFGVLAATLKEA